MRLQSSTRAKMDYIDNGDYIVSEDNIDDREKSKPFEMEYFIFSSPSAFLKVNGVQSSTQNIRIMIFFCFARLQILRIKVVTVANPISELICFARKKRIKGNEVYKICHFQMFFQDLVTIEQRRSIKLLIISNRI
jgi:hypothetical protein